MSSSLPIKHHYLPVFYLNRWTGKDGRLFRYYRPLCAVVVSPITPRNTAFEEGLYSLDGVAAEQRQIVETQFMSPAVDSPAALVVDKMLRGGVRQLTGDERVEFTRFLLSLEYRGPQAIKEMEALAENTIRHLLDVTDDAEYAAAKGPDDPATLHEWATQHTPEMLANAHKRWLPGIVDNPEVGQHVINMPWEIIDVSGSPHSLLTADRPLIRELGLDDPKAIWALPLSPTHLFAAANDARILRSLKNANPNRVVPIMNDLLVRHAVRYVYGNSDKHLAFVEKRLRRVDDAVVPGTAARVLAQQRTERT